MRRADETFGEVTDLPGVNLFLYTEYGNAWKEEKQVNQDPQY